MKRCSKGRLLGREFRERTSGEEVISKLDPDEFISIMQKWAAAYAPSEISPVPGMEPADFARPEYARVNFPQRQSDFPTPREQRMGPSPPSAFAAHRSALE